MTLAASILNYLQDQTLANYLEVRRHVNAAANYSPYANFEQAAAPLMAQEKYPDMIGALRAFLPGGFLSFGLHSLLAYAYDKMANREDTQREAYLAQAVMRGLLQTGDGSLSQPYQVLYVSDEYDVLRYFGKQSSQTHLFQSGEKALEQHICTDGAEIWFDISAFAGASSPNPM